MAVIGGPNSTEDGLVFCVDATNTKSYPGNGNIWYDLAGGNNMTLFGSYGVSNKGMTFDGSTTYARSTKCGLGLGSRIPHSQEMIVYFTNITNGRWWLSNIGQYSTGANHWIGTSATSKQFGTWSGACQRNPDLPGNNVWVHIISTFDGTNLTHYVNGVNSGGTCEATGFNFTNEQYTIGLRLGNEKNFVGSVSIAKLYSRALTADEVELNYYFYKKRFNL